MIEWREICDKKGKGEVIMESMIQEELLEHIGQRIKLYRTRQKMTITQLGEMVHLSPSNISKYENAKLSIDVCTIFRIADALGVTTNQLMDYREPVTQEKYRTNTINFFRRSNLFYMYQYFGIDKRIHACVIEVTNGGAGELDKVSLYYSCEDLENYVDSGYIYTGTMSCHDFTTNFFCRNLYNPCDEIAICAKSTFSTEKTTTGLLNGLSQSLRNPYAVKVLFSLHPLPQDEILKANLNISDKETYSEIKRTNSLIVY